MGCFSVSCNLSGLSIYSDKIGIVLLKKAEYSDLYHSKNFICTNAGAEGLFVPAFPIIYGNCDTYGNIENIEEKPGFKYTCEKLGIPATESNFHEFIEKDWMNEPSDGYYISFFLKDVIKKAIKYQRKENSICNYLCQHSILENNPDIFEFVGEHETEKRYNQIYVHKLSGTRILSDGSFIHLESNENSGIYRTKNMEFLSVKEYKKIISTKETYLHKKIKGQIENANSRKTLDDYVKNGGDINSVEYTKLLLKQFMIYKDFGEVIDYTGMPEEVIEEIVDLKCLSSFMFFCNRYYSPCFSGEQISEFKHQQYLNDISGEYIKKKKRHRF